jgi:hypothetical protein
MDLVPTLVAYHSVHWMWVAVESYLEQFPGERLLVIDNNPKRGEAGWTPDCERERHWLAAHPGVVLVDNPAPPDGLLANRTHGAAMDLALDWCRRRAADVMVHLEPDCLVTGRRWRDNLVGALAGGAWMAGSVRQCHGPIHPTPSAWRVGEVRASFKITPWRGADERHPRFAGLMDLEALKHDRSPMGVWIGWTCHWDTAHKAWFEAAVCDLAALVEAPGIRHYWHGSQERRLSARTLAAWYPEVAPYLERGRRRAAPEEVEGCPHRHAVRKNGRGELATCGLLERVSGLRAPDLCAVGRDACRACRSCWPPAADNLNPVVASLLFRLAGRVVERGGVPGCAVADAERLMAAVEPDLHFELP